MVPEYISILRTGSEPVQEDKVFGTHPTDNCLGLSDRPKFGSCNIDLQFLRQLSWDCKA